MGLRIPEEFSILGFDDTDSRYMVYPTMTAVCQDSRELGRAAFDQMMRICGIEPSRNDPDGSGHIVGNAWLEINHTTGRAPNHAIRVLPNGQRMESERAVGAIEA